LFLFFSEKFISGHFKVLLVKRQGAVPYKELLFGQVLFRSSHFTPLFKKLLTERTMLRQVLPNCALKKSAQRLTLL
jgi:hypothetical protein